MKRIRSKQLKEKTKVSSRKRITSKISNDILPNEEDSQVYIHTLLHNKNWAMANNQS